jgi:hypothetical protein
MTAAVQPIPQQAAAPRSLVARMAERYGADPAKFLETVKATAFRQRADRDGNTRTPTNEELFALLAIAERYGLDVFTRELFAYLDPKSGAIVPVVSVDGWVRIINAQPELRSIRFVYSEETGKHKGKTIHEWIECHIARSDRDDAMVIREYFAEVVREVNFATPWDTHPNRMHRHKALIQCARIAFGFAGIYDADEAARILEGVAGAPVAASAAAVDALNARVQGRSAPALEHAPAQGIPTTIEGKAERVTVDRDAARMDVDARVAESAAGDPPPKSGPTFAHVAERINAAKDADALAEARDLIRGVADEGHRADLETVAQFRADELAKAAK